MISPKSSKLYLTLLSSWLSRESLKMKELFFFACVPTNRRILVPGVPSGDRGNWG